jgi:hypothetical protein
MNARSTECPEVFPWLKKEGSAFVLVVCDDFCFWLTRYHFQLMINFNYALRHATTWGDFLCICGPDNRAYIESFVETDEHRPTSEEMLNDLKDECKLWVLYDTEFPGTQCAEETTTFFGRLFPSDYVIETIYTEYRHEIDLYGLEGIDEMIKEVEQSGILVERVNCPFPVDLRNYGL